MDSGLLDRIIDQSLNEGNPDVHKTEGTAKNFGFLNIPAQRKPSGKNETYPAYL